MKTKFALLVAGAAVTAMTMLPLAAEAGPGRGARMERLIEALQLTPTQQEELQVLREDHKTQREAIFTPTQLQVLEEAEAGNISRREVRQQLNLTDGQREQMRALRESMKEDFQSILTPEQQQQLETLKANRGERRGRRNQ